MGQSKLSVTIPEQTYREIKAFASIKKVKLSHLVAEALAEKTQKLKEDSLLQRINEVFKDPEAEKEQFLMAETIAEATDVKEMPW